MRETSAPHGEISNTNDATVRSKIADFSPQNISVIMAELQPLPALHLREARATSPQAQKPPDPAPNLPPLPAHLSLTPITTEHQLSQFRRITTLLLPIPYPASFYTETLTSPSTALALIATYAPPQTAATVVGGIRCRVEERDEGGRG